MKRKLLIGLVILALLISASIWKRHRILVKFATTGAPIPKAETANTVPGGTYFGEDQYFAVVQLDEKTFAIAEPYSWARNYNYLILGDERALLFDAGVGHYDIRPVIETLTDLPLTFMPSHFHYDHTGQGEWERTAIVDLPHVRAQADGNTLPFTWEQHLGPSEAIPVPTWQVSDWVKPNTQIDLGGRLLTLLYTPGHTDNSVSLYDKDRQLMFAGDFLTSSGSMSSFLPTARLGDYLQSADKVLLATENQMGVIFHGAHANEANELPRLDRQFLQAFRDQLTQIKSGELKGTGAYPVVYVINADISLSTEPRWLHNWKPTYPDGHAIHEIKAP